MNRPTVLFRFLIVASLLACLLSCGCTGGTADVHLDSDYALVSADDENLTADFDVIVTAVNTGTVKARNLVVLVTMQQLAPGDAWEDRVAGSDLVSATVLIGTLAPGASTTESITLTLHGNEESYALLKDGVYIELTAEVAQVDYYTSSWLDFL